MLDISEIMCYHKCNERNKIKILLRSKGGFTEFSIITAMEVHFYESIR